MALIKCSECGKKISDKAFVCPNCGYPVKKNQEEMLNENEESNESKVNLNSSNKQNIKKGKKKYYWIVVGIILGCLTLFSIVFFFMTRDEEPPQIENLPEQIELKVGEDFEAEQLLANVKVIDNKSTNLGYTVQTEEVNINTPGEYYIIVQASDKVGNTSEEKVKVIISDYPVHMAYMDAVNLEKEKLQKDSLGRYSFNGINIADEEMEWLEDGAIYRSIAKQLEGFYLIKSMYNNWGNTIVETVWGFEKPQTWDELKPYADDAILLISRKQSVGEIMTIFQKLSCVDGDFDYVNGEFNFTISDLTEVANELRITEEMLGYILAYLEEYAPITQFNGNSYTCEYKWLGADRKNIDESEFNIYANFSESKNVISLMPDQGASDSYYYFAYAPEVIDETDNYLDLAYLTKRGICVRDSIDAVRFAYGGGDIVPYDKNSDITYEGFLFNNDSNHVILDMCTQYIAYRIGDMGNIAFFFDKDGILLMIGYYNVVVY